MFILANWCVSICELQSKQISQPSISNCSCYLLQHLARMKDTIDTGIVISHNSLPRWHNSFLVIIPRGRIHSAETKLGFQTQYKGSENVQKVSVSFAFLKADVNTIQISLIHHNGEKNLPAKQPYSSTQISITVSIQ